MSRIVASSIVLPLCAAVSLCACGAARSPSARTRPAATRARAVLHAPPPAGARGDRALALAALVRRADVPARWTEQRAIKPELHCRSRPFRGARTSATSARFVQENTSFEETVAIYRDVAASRRALTRLDGRASIACLLRSVHAHMNEQTEGTATEPQLARSEAIGANGLALRFTASGESQVGVVQGVIDAVHLRAGRGLGALLIVSGPNVIDEAVYERVVALFERRLHAALG